MLPDFRVRQRDYLLEISRAITQELDLDKVLARILNVSVEMLAGQAGLIALRDEQAGWRVTVSRGIPSAFLEKLEPLLSTVPEGEVSPTQISLVSRLTKTLRGCAKPPSVRSAWAPVLGLRLLKMWSKTSSRLLPESAT